MEMRAWIVNINNSWSKPSSPGIEQSQSILFKQDYTTLPHRKLPEPPVAKDISQTDSYLCYDKPNPLIRPVAPVEEELYSDISDIPKIEENLLSLLKVKYFNYLLIVIDFSV